MLTQKAKGERRKANRESREASSAPHRLRYFFSSLNCRCTTSKPSPSISFALPMPSSGFPGWHPPGPLHWTAGCRKSCTASVPSLPRMMRRFHQSSLFLPVQRFTSVRLFRGLCGSRIIKKFRTAYNDAFRNSVCQLFPYGYPIYFSAARSSFRRASFAFFVQCSTSKPWMLPWKISTWASTPASRSFSA